MNTWIRYFFSLLILWLSCISYSTPVIHHNGQQKNVVLIIHFRATVNGEPLVIKKNYTNSFGESFSIEKFKFYFGSAGLTSPGEHVKTSLQTDRYALIDFTDSSTCVIKLKTIPGRYSGIQFLLGVDSIDNISGAQTGALDPAKGMFWTWNSGYVMAKLEGTSPVSTQPAHSMAYHIGGFKEPYNAARTISLAFANDSQLEISENKTSELYITAEVNQWFNGAHPLHIKETAVCTTPGILAKNISENYAKMFSISQIIN